MPNGLDNWIFWYQIKPEQWEHFLKDFHQYKPKIRLLSGVETELCNEAGDINIPFSEQAKLDFVQLSVHYMIDLDCLKMDLIEYPDVKSCPQFDNEVDRAKIERWRERTIDVGEENIIAGLVNGYMNAIKKNKKVKSLAHMNDGLDTLRTYLVDLAKVKTSRKVEIFEPLFKLMAEENIMWEILGNIQEEAIIIRANEMNVPFTATADSHMLNEGWGPLVNHYKAEEIIEKYKLNRGRIEI